MLIHDTATMASKSFNANALAKALARARSSGRRTRRSCRAPASSTFFFCPTGDTDAHAGNQPALAARGAWGSIFRVSFTGHDGTISIAVLGDAVHSSFDNLTFADSNTILATEDRGDALHGS